MNELKKNRLNEIKKAKSSFKSLTQNKERAKASQATYIRAFANHVPKMNISLSPRLWEY